MVAGDIGLAPPDFRFPLTCMRRVYIWEIFYFSRARLVFCGSWWVPVMERECEHTYTDVIMYTWRCLDGSSCWIAAVKWPPVYYASHVFFYDTPTGVYICIRVKEHTHRSFTEIIYVYLLDMRGVSTALDSFKGRQWIYVRIYYWDRWMHRLLFK